MYKLNHYHKDQIQSVLTDLGKYSFLSGVKISNFDISLLSSIQDSMRERYISNPSDINWIENLDSSFELFVVTLVGEIFIKENGGVWVSQLYKNFLPIGIQHNGIFLNRFTHLIHDTIYEYPSEYTFTGNDLSGLFNFEIALESLKYEAGLVD